MWVWEVFFARFPMIAFFSGFRALFIRPTNTFFSKNNFKTRSYGTFNTFKNYFTIIFLIFSNKWYSNRSLIWKVFFARFPTIAFFSGFRALFIRPRSTFFSKNNFKTGSYGTFNTFKNYFTIVFLVFSNKRYLNKPLDES